MDTISNVVRMPSGCSHPPWCKKKLGNPSLVKCRKKGTRGLFVSQRYQEG